MDKLDLRKRVISGAIYGIIVILCISIHKWSTAILLYIFSFLTLSEFINTVKLIKKNREPNPYILYALLTIITILSLIKQSFISNGIIILLFFWCMILIVISIMLFTGKELLNRWISFFFGVIYIGIAFYSAFKIRLYGEVINSGGLPLLFLMFIIWLSDTMAYFGGSMFGRNPLLPEVSPKKTIEGTLTGIFFAGLFGYFASEHMIDKPPIIGGLMAIILSSFSTTGDLFQSHIKRLAGIKDSGSIMPGHGGAWDRLDSFLFVMPIGYLMLKFF